MAEMKLPLVRTVFLPKGSPGICTVREVKADIRRSEVSCADGKIFCAGEADLLIEYLSFAEGPEEKGANKGNGAYATGGGKMWQALVTLPFELVEEGNLSCPPLSDLQIGEVKWFMVAPRALEMEIELILNWQDSVAEPDLVRQPKYNAWRKEEATTMEKEKWAVESLVDNQKQEEIIEVERGAVKKTVIEETAPHKEEAPKAKYETVTITEEERAELLGWQKEEAPVQKAAVKPEEDWEAELDDLVQIAVERAAGVAEKEAGLAEKAAGEAEREAGLREQAAGEAELAAGLREKAAGEAEREAGLREKAAGEAEREAGLREQAAGEAELAAGLAAKAAGEAEREAGLHEKAAAGPRIVMKSSTPPPKPLPKPQIIIDEIPEPPEKVPEPVKAVPIPAPTTKARKGAVGLPQLKVKTSATANETKPSGYCVSFYRVRMGDTLAGISAHTGVPAEKILEMNQMQNQALQPNMVLRLP